MTLQELSVEYRAHAETLSARVKELERRLRDRGTDDPEKVQKRLLRAKVEFQTAHTYDYFVINDTVEQAVEELRAILCAEHCKPAERMELILNGKEM